MNKYTLEIHYTNAPNKGSMQFSIYRDDVSEAFAYAADKMKPGDSVKLLKVEAVDEPERRLLSEALEFISTGASTFTNKQRIELVDRIKNHLTR